MTAFVGVATDISVDRPPVEQLEPKTRLAHVELQLQLEQTKRTCYISHTAGRKRALFDDLPPRV
jgi:hypothetical protein